MKARGKLTSGYHVVCLLDVLGQKERLAEWGEPPIDGREEAAHLQALKNTVGVVIGFQKAFEGYFEQVDLCTMPKQFAGLDDDQRERYRRFKECHLNIQQFSDTFVFYAPIPNAHGDVSVVPLSRMIGACCIGMLLSLAARRPVRGGLAIGMGMELAERTFYGPALVEAHCLESKVAQYPRIALSPQVDEFLNVVRDSTKVGWVADWMRKLAGVCSSMLDTDRDGRRVVDYMGEAMRRSLPVDAKSRQAFRLAYDFACTEAERFRREGNLKLADRYNKLRQYMETRGAGQ